MPSYFIIEGSLLQFGVMDRNNHERHCRTPWQREPQTGVKGVQPQRGRLGLLVPIGQDVHWALQQYAQDERPE